MIVKAARDGDMQWTGLSVSDGHDKLPAVRSPKAIGARLTLVRELSGLTQAQFSKRIRVTQGTCSAWESGKRPPGLKIAHALCDVYRLTLDYIYRGDPSGLSHRLMQEINRRTPAD